MKGGEEDSNYCLVYLCLFLASITASFCLCFYYFLFKTLVHFEFIPFSFIFSMFVSISMPLWHFSVLLRYCQYVLSTSHLYLGRIVPRCIYFMYFALDV